MDRFLEFILGVDKSNSGFLSRPGSFSVKFHPQWPFQDTIGVFGWNFLLALAAIILVAWVYRREGRSVAVRISLAILRLVVLAFVILMLNRPHLTLTHNRTEPSVLAILIDDTVSMNVKDGGVDAKGLPVSRFDAIMRLLDDRQQQLLHDLAKTHEIRFFRLDSDAHEFGGASGQASSPTTAPASPDQKADPRLVDLTGIQPKRNVTQVLTLIRTVLDRLHGDHLAGVVVLTDGRDNPRERTTDLLEEIRGFNVHIYPVAVGTEKIRNIGVEGIAMEDQTFVNDLVNTTVHIRSTGYKKGHSITVVLKDKATGQPLLSVDSRKPAETTIEIDGDGAKDVEINFKPQQPGTLNVVAEVPRQPGEAQTDDNTFTKQIEVLDAKINVLYVEGYPRWEYRYLRDELLTRRTSSSTACCSRRMVHGGSRATLTAIPSA